MSAHTESTYKDGFKNVRFCVVCGKEENDLIGTECEAISSQEKVEKEVDRKPTEN